VIESRVAVEIRVRGIVQGVGFRPNVWRLARACGVTGDVRNDAEGVLVRATGDRDAVERFVSLVRDDAPPLARIGSLEVVATDAAIPTDAFTIVASGAGRVSTQVAPDAAVCAACREETLDPFLRRYRYPFGNCTHCGPRLSIVTRLPYDRANTSMAAFVRCAECEAEYADPEDRRFHAQPIACHRCGPRAKLERMDGKVVTFDMHSMLDDVDAARSLLQKGEIVAIKGIGGFHLACDATNPKAVETLRARKVREDKPFALMAFDVETIRRYCSVDAIEDALLASSEAPIVLLRADGPERLPEGIAPGMRELGFMLPPTPLHVLLLRRMGRPVVMTSGNRSNEPQATRNEDARERLGTIADYMLSNDRAIASRVDDSVVRVVRGRTRVVRRARGYAPSPIALPSGFERAPDLLALGAELKSTFCAIAGGSAVLSQHQGDLEDPATFDDYRHNLALYEQLFERAPEAIAVDRHPDYLSSSYGRERARRDALPLLEVQHHHAHVASVLVENGRALSAPPVLGIALDGLGYGDDDELWGGEFLIADYRTYRRVGTFKPVALIGGAAAVREPWRNTYAHLCAEMGWAEFAMNFADLELFAFLAAKPRATLDGMLAGRVNSPRASSCGRLFDAVAAALGLARERATFEGRAAMLLEAIVDRDALASDAEESAYPFAIPRLGGRGLPYIEPLGMWRALLGDLISNTSPGIVSARFHRGLARAIVAMATQITSGEYADERPPDTIALSGGCFQNAVLFDTVVAGLERAGFTVLANARVPSNDGGIALGQAAIAAATLLAPTDSERTAI
jgi:hydrogenase maturation protein HypF